MLTFEQPFLLLLLLPIGLLVFLTWRHMSLPFPRRQRALILACRAALFTLIVLALAGPALGLPVSRQSIVFVGDISASTAPQQAFIAQWINGAIAQKRPEDQIGIVAVGRNALVEQAVTTQISFSQFQSTPDTNYTDLAAGLRLAAAIMPNDSERRIVLLSDGQQNLGNALQEAQLLQQEGIRLDVVPLPESSGPEARVDGLTAPNTLRTNEHFVLHAQLFSNVAQTVTVRLYLDQTLLIQQKMALAAGEQEITFNLLAPPPGFHAYRLTIDAPLDTVLQNNEAAAFVSVQGPPHVLVVEGQPGAGQNIVAALQATHITVTVSTPFDVPTTLEGLANYDAVVLADVPAVSLGNIRMQVLQSFVRDLGRGLVVSGGENSYGPGAYANTPLEETLPLTMDIPPHKDKPAIAVVLIIESLEADAPINISKEAAKGVVNLLTPRDYVGISAAAATGALTVPMQHVTDKNAIDHAIDTMTPNDPESYLPDLIAAEQALIHTNAAIKHVILLGDGDAPDSYDTQVLKMASEHISLSVVGTNINRYQDLIMMKQMATLGRGHFYRADDPQAIPQILLDETRQATRQAVVEEPFTPAIVGAHPILAGLSALPNLEGYVSTTPKPAAQLVLISHLDDPVLAVWQYGLGHVVAWTSDALGLWTTNWLHWRDAARWWANLVTWTLPTPDSQLIVNGTIVGSNGQITVDLPAGVTPTQSQGNSQQVQVRIIAPDRSQQTITLQATAPGRWEGNFPSDQVGVYLLRVTWQGKGASSGGSTQQLSTTTGMVVPYSPEYNSVGTDLTFLNQLAHTAGGSILGPFDYPAAFAQNLSAVYTDLSITFWLFALAALLLPVDVALRRLSSLEFLFVGYRWVATRLGLGRGEQGEVSQVLEAMQAHRAGRRNRKAARASILPHLPSVRAPGGRTAGIPGAPATTATPEAPAQPETPEKQPEAPATSKLLEAKRKRAGSKGRKSSKKEVLER